MIFAVMLVMLVMLEILVMEMEMLVILEKVNF